MTILGKLIALYREAGYEAMTGYNPHHFDGWMAAPYTRFIHQNRVVGTAGMALQEIMVLEGLAEHLAPQRILIIGNAMGWSTIALGLIFPKAQILAIDPDNGGNDLTNRLAKQAKLSIEAVHGYSPQDVQPLAAKHLKGPVDLVLIDAIHTPEAVGQDWRAAAPLADDGTVWLFHDIIDWKLHAPFWELCAAHGLAGRILTRTASGMAAAWKEGEARKGLADYLSIFSDNPDLFRAFRQAALSTQGRQLDQVFQSLK